MSDAGLTQERPDTGLSFTPPTGLGASPPTSAASVVPDDVEAARRALLRALRDEPTSFSFAQAVRLLERLRPGHAPVGGWADPSDEVARFTVHPSLGFPSSELQALELPESMAAAADADGSRADDGDPARLQVNFFGLIGPQGVLPHVYTEYAATRARVKDTALRDFLDLFHHRALSLLYRAWERSHFAVSYESRREDRLQAHLLDLAGLGTAGLRERLPSRDDALAYYAGLLSNRTRPADGLARLVGDYFDVPAHVEQFVGEWRRVSDGGQSTLGVEADAGRLGFGVIGDVAWDAQARVRLRLGPLTRAQFDAFLPGGDAHAALVSLARLYADDQVGVDAQLVLLREAVTGCTLGTSSHAEGGPAPPPVPRLGRGSWLASRAMSRDPDETVLALC